MRRLLGLVTVLVLILFAACGEKSEAPRPAASEAVRPATSPRAPDRCEHNMPPAVCPKCVPALAAVYQSKGDWCQEHGFPESLCPICNPDAKFPDVGGPAATPADWCGGHGLPESKCTKCNPSLVEQFKASGDWCEEHGFWPLGSARNSCHGSASRRSSSTPCGARGEVQVQQHRMQPMYR